MLTINNLSKSFNHLQVLENITFSVDTNEIVVIMGESGIGKSTLLRCIAKLETPDQGEVLINNQAVDNGKIGFIFQNYNLFPHKTIFNNTLEPLLINKVDRTHAIQRVTSYLQRLNIADKAHQYPYQLSGGQQQRAAIARSCALLPEYLCFDEPTSALDEKSIDDVIRIIRDISNQNIGILIVTHDKQFAAQIATRIIYLSKPQ
jgi:polar amino acid transport system ATP-binding protein